MLKLYRAAQTKKTAHVFAALCLALVGCSGNGAGGDASSIGSGGAAANTSNGGGNGLGSGGATTYGGAATNGGATATSSANGGVHAGGTNSNGAQGGAANVGGSLSAGGNASNGGAANQGGTTSSSGGNTVGGSAKGGNAITGGNSTKGGTTTGLGGSATGGSALGGSATGGSSAKGGTVGSGGIVGSGGSSGNGGVVFGGVSGSDGGVAAGGTSNPGCPGETSGLPANKIVYVSPTGKAANTGTAASSPKDLASALSAVQPGDTLLLAPGTYAIAYTAGAKNTITLSKAGTVSAPIQIVAANCGRAVIDFSFPEQQWVQDSVGILLTGSYYYLKGLDFVRAGYQGVYVTGQHNTFENCSFHDNRNTGLEINEGGSYTTVINCDAYRNYDPKKFGGMADGFGPKQTQGPGNKFIGCRAWENSDDGFDAFDSPQVVTFEKCWAFRNGVDVWNYGGFDGNGNGFKVGGNGALANHKLTQSVAFGNVVKGFDQNNNTGGITLYNCTSYNNGINFGLGGALASGQEHVFKNNVSLGGGANSYGANATQQNNTWNSGFTVSAADFESLDLTLATRARSIDGSLPKTSLFRPKAGGALVDKGVNVGLGYSGAAPDLGAFELGQ